MWRSFLSLIHTYMVFRFESKIIIEFENKQIYSMLSIPFWFCKYDIYIILKIDQVGRIKARSFLKRRKTFVVMHLVVQIFL